MFFDGWRVEAELGAQQLELVTLEVGSATRQQEILSALELPEPARYFDFTPASTS